MSIRPVDMIAPVQTSPDINRTAQNETNRPHVANQQFSEQLQKEVQLNDQQVTQTNQTEGRSVDKDGKGNADSGQGKKRGRRNHSEQERKKEKQSTSMFDVSI